MCTPLRATGLTVLLLLLTQAAWAGTWRVGRNRTDCPGNCHFYDNPPGTPNGGGVWAAMVSPSVIAGDTVRVWPGTYGTRFSIKSNVKLISEGGPAVTILQGQAGQEPLCTMTATGPSTLIEGFRIIWNAQATGTGGGVAAYVASGTIRNNVFRDCIASIGSGIYVQFGDVVVENNLFVNNRCEGGGGVVAVTGGAPVIRNNTFYGSMAPFGYQGAAFYGSGSEFTFTRNLVVGSTGGTAVYCAGTNLAEVSCNLLWDNVMGAFGGTCVDSTGASGNLATNPYLCNAPAGDFGVCSDSPAVNVTCGTPPTVGPIGYVSPTGNCAPCVPVPAPEIVESVSWGTIKARYR